MQKRCLSVLLLLVVLAMSLLAGGRAVAQEYADPSGIASLKVAVPREDGVPDRSEADSALAEGAASDSMVAASMVAGGALADSVLVGVAAQSTVAGSAVAVEAVSDSTPSLPSYRIEEILVTAAKLSSFLEKVPAAVSVIGRSEIEQSMEKSVVGILEEKEGVNPGSYGSFGALELISLRGGRFGRTATLLDGVTINNAQNGAADLYSVPSFLLERIEILRGPLGSLHGGNGVTGVVNFVTAEPGSDGKPVATVGVSSGSLAYRKVVATFARRYGQLGTFFGMEEGASSGVGAYRGYSGKNHFGKVSYDFGARGTIACLLSTYSGVLKTVRDAKQKSNVDRFQMVGSMSVGAGKRLEVRTFRSVETTDFADPFVSTVSELETYGTLLDLYGYETALGDVGLGAGYTESDLSCRDGLGSWNPNTRQAYVLAQNQVSVGKDMTALISLRGDHHSSFGTEISPYASLWREGVNERIWLSLGRGFNPPTLNDLFWPTQRSIWAGWTYVTMGNRTLDAESSWMVELGSEFTIRDGSIRGGLTGFLSRTTNFIDWSSVESAADSTTTYMPLNLNEVNVRGIEGHVVLASGGERVAGFNLTLQRVEGEAAELLPYMPEFRANSWFTRSFEPFPELVVTFRLDATHIGDYLEPTGVSEPPTVWSEGPFFLLEERLSASIAGFTAYFRFRNVTDEEYPSRYLESPYTQERGRPLYYPMPGRQYEIGMTWRLID